ncbi:MAG: PAS domain-containing protein [Rhodospirillaceae bacterium]|nr:PAS domain-containing protein [Rhodospirillaceae bacterium]
MDDAVNRSDATPLPANPEAILAAVAAATVAVDHDMTVRYVNAAAEQLFQTSAAAIIGEALTTFLPHNGAVMSLIEQARREGSPVSAYGVNLDTPRTGVRSLTVHVAPMPETTGWLVLSLQEQTRALKIGQQLEHRNAARSMTAMASLLAHEVKNPLSGIRGAAQLLEQGAAEDDRRLTQLICDECDRIVALVDRMEVFSDERPLARQPVNIHIVLERVRRIAENGFAKSLKIVEKYDPSLPAVDGNHDQLVQAFLNLIKNAAEAAPRSTGEIVITTSYKQGVRVSLPGTTGRVQLPLVVTIQDNGPGIPDDIRSHLFEPFITTKPKGSGLGLALVAKIISDHGGIIEFESEPKRTVFRVMLPIVSNGEVVDG